MQQSSPFAPMRLLVPGTSDIDMIHADSPRNLSPQKRPRSPDLMGMEEAAGMGALFDKEDAQAQTRGRKKLKLQVLPNGRDVTMDNVNLTRLGWSGFTEGEVNRLCKKRSGSTMRLLPAYYSTSAHQPGTA